MLTGIIIIIVIIIIIYMNKLAGQCGFPSVGELARAQALSSY